MPALQPLKALLERTESERDAALAEHRRARAANETAQAQAEQLLAYRREYEQRWGERFSREGKIELVRCYQGFMERLTQAVEAQARAAQHAVRQLEASQARLLEHEMRVASVRKLIERRIHEAQQQAARREQKRHDEASSRHAWQRLADKRHTQH